MLHANSMLFHIWDLAKDYGICRGAVLELILTESEGPLYLHIFGSKRNEEWKNATM